jgi:hypothetical protein
MRDSDDAGGMSESPELTEKSSSQVAQKISERQFYISQHRGLRIAYDDRHLLSSIFDAQSFRYVFFSRLWLDTKRFPQHSEDKFFEIVANVD